MAIVTALLLFIYLFMVLHILIWYDLVIHNYHIYSSSLLTCIYQLFQHVSFYLDYVSQFYSLIYPWGAHIHGLWPFYFLLYWYAWLYSCSSCDMFIFSSHSNAGWIPTLSCMILEKIRCFLNQQQMLARLSNYMFYPDLIFSLVLIVQNNSHDSWDLIC